MAYTAEGLFDYMEGISERVGERMGSGYSTDEERAAYYRAIYDELDASEAEQETLWDAEDEVLESAISMLDDENFHGEAAALTAYMYNKYQWHPKIDMDDEMEAFFYLYE